MKLRVLAAVFAALLPAMAYAQSGTPMSDQSLYNGLPDNTTQAILPSNVRNVVASKASIFPVTSSAAAGTSCTSGATALASSFNVVTSGTGYVVATTGYTEIWNETSAPINVCPPITSANFNSLSAGTPIIVASGASLRVSMTSATHGYIIAQSGPTQNATGLVSMNQYGVVQGPLTLMKLTSATIIPPGAGLAGLYLIKGATTGTCRLVVVGGTSATTTQIGSDFGGGC